MKAIEAGARADQPDEWLIVKRGLYFMPDCRGYTGIRDQAGRYSHEFAKGYERDGVSIVHISDALEFMPAAFDDLVIAHLTKQRDEARRELAAIASGELVPASAVAAERERCAQAAEGNSPSFNMSQALNECRDSEAGFHSGRIAAAKSIRSLSPEPSTSGEWRDISTAPDDGTEILGYWRGSKTHAIISWSIDGWWKDNADHSAVSPPTHWMPLPEPPAMLTAATKDGERK